MNYKINITLLLLVVGFANCKKEGAIIPDENLAHFQNQTIANYFIQNSPTSVYEIPVGSATVSNQPRTITYTVTSPTGAVAGTQYSIANSGSVTIPAGQSTATISVRGIFTGYPTGRRDTLRFTLTGGDATAAEYNKSFDLVMQKYCNVDMNSFLGNYSQTIETFGTGAPYGPYNTSISAVTSTGATKARIVVQNIWDSGWGPIEFDLDWTDPANFKATVVPKTTGVGDAGTISSTYAGMQVAVRPYAGSDGTFSSCDGTLTLRLQLGVTGLGYFSQLYTVRMAK